MGVTRRGHIFVIRMGNNKKEQSHKNEWEVKNKNKNHVQGMKNQEKNKLQ